jgi:ABC-type amino acid transport substrate-binding protein
MKQQTGARNLRLIGGGLVLAALIVVAAVLWLAPGTLPFLRIDTTWRTMQANGVWRVGMDPSFPPFETLDDAGQIVGFDVALADAIAAPWGVQVELVPIGFDSLLDALQAGKVDSVLSALPYDERLTKDVAYSAPYFEAGIFLAVRTDSQITETAALANGTIGVEWGSMGDMVGRRLQKATPSLQLKPFDTPTAAITALVDERAVDAILIDHVTLRIAQVQGAPLITIGPVLESNSFVIAMPVRAHELQAAVAERLLALQNQGVIVDLEATHFQEAP